MGSDSIFVICLFRLMSNKLMSLFNLAGRSKESFRKKNLMKIITATLIIVIYLLMPIIYKALRICKNI